MYFHPHLMLQSNMRVILKNHGHNKSSPYQRI
jgi:hypothetical protein